MAEEAQETPQKRQQQAAKPRRKPNRGSWQKGRSGNPGGRRKVEGTIRELAFQLCPDAIRILGEIMRDPGQPAPARVTAAREILDRGIGRPLQSVEVSGQDGQPIPMAYTPARAVHVQRPPDPETDPTDGE